MPTPINRNNANIGAPASNGVTVPDDPAMALEPSTTIGSIFADKAMLKTIIVALLGVVASFGVTVADGVADNVVTLVWALSTIITAAVAQQEASNRAKAQGQATRAAVYSPVSAAAIARGEPVPPVLDVLDSDTWT